MSENKERDGVQKGAQAHAEGQHGKKAHSRMIEELNSGASGEERGSLPQQGAPVEGRHRLYEDRQQHDEAELKSEKNRAAREVERGRHPIDEERYERFDREER